MQSSITEGGALHYSQHMRVWHFWAMSEEQAAHAARNANGTISCRQRAHGTLPSCPTLPIVPRNVAWNSPADLARHTFTFAFFCSQEQSLCGLGSSSYRIRLMLLGRGHCSFCCRCADSSPSLPFPSLPLAPSLSVCELMQAEYYVSHFKFARILLAALHAACVSCWHTTHMLNSRRYYNRRQIQI